MFLLFFVIIGVFFYFNGIANSQLLLIGEVPNVLLVPGIILFGLLGGIVSAILSLRKSFGQSRIVELISNKAIIISRIFIGVASALFIYVFLKTGLLDKIIETNLEIKSPYVFFAISFIAGFTERLVLKAVEPVAGKEKQSHPESCVMIFIS